MSNICQSVDTSSSQTHRFKGLVQSKDG